MRELRFDGLSPDGTHLVLAGKDGQRWSVAIDERIVAAIRRDRARLSQVELEQSGGLRPREIQARIRAGATAEDVAAASGLAVEHVRRFEGPVLTERAWVAQQARATEVRRPGGDIELGELVAERLADQGVDVDDIVWDAWRRDDGLWVVIATFPIPPNTLVATWTYDGGSRTMTVVDDNARALSSIAVEGPVRLVASTRPTLASVAPLPTSSPEAASPAGDSELDDGPGPVPSVHPAGSAADEAGSPDDADEPHDLAATDEPDEDEPAADEPAADEPDGAEPAPGDESALGEESDRDDEPTDAPPEDAGRSEATAEDATEDTAEAPLFDSPAAPAAPRSTGRPPVPSFDDILFGPGRTK